MTIKAEKMPRKIGASRKERESPFSKPSASLSEYAVASGTTAMRAARKRPRVPILALSPDPTIARRLALLWGTLNVLSNDIASYDEMVESARKHALADGFARPGEQIVVIAGIPFGTPGSTNNLRVVTV